ncbi:MAG: bifunctional riboflavin kinase/FAD synthetase [Bacteroidota bacterium]
MNGKKLKVCTHLDSWKNVKNPVITTGTFDGVHLGHKKIISRLKEIAEKNDGETVLFTFSPHPRTVLFPDDTNIKMLNTQSEKIALLEEAGIDHLVIFPFTKEFSRLSAVEYVRDILVNKLHISKLVIGYDHHFGRNREGSIANLKELAPLYGFEVEEIPAQEVDDIKVSSTKIRTALQQGDVYAANTYLGYRYHLSGLVVSGQKVGREIGFPTANIQVMDAQKLIPADGVYAVKVKTKSGFFDGMLNIGLRPTVSEPEGKRTIEVNIFDFSNELYNEILHIEFINKIRNEVKFDNVEQLRKQLEKDKEQAKKLLA